MRIPEQPTYDEAKRIILGIIQENGGTFNGSTLLYKAFYDAHLFHWQRYGTYLTTHPVVHMPRGPGIDDGPVILAALQREGRLTITQRMVGPHDEDVYRIVGDVQINLEDTEREAIRKALAWVEGKSAVQISQESHELSRTWREAQAAHQTGHSLHIYLDALSDEEIEQKQVFSRQAEALLDASPAE